MYYCKTVAKNDKVAIMTKQNPRFEEILREHGLSMTKQRAYLFELLIGSEPLSLHELYDVVNAKMDRASLYRNIAVFEQLGIVRRVNIGWKYKIELSDTFAEHHHHLTCIGCHTIIPINERELESFISGVAESHGFKAIEHQVEVQGYCKFCDITRGKSV
jgi:Fur family ferric uptake transcriptional regulator